jgi:DNA-binding MarR family transcriptional regulator
MARGTKTPTKANNGDRIHALAKEIRLMRKKPPVSSAMGIVLTAEAISEYIRKELRKFLSNQVQFRLLDALILNDGRMRATDMSILTFRSKVAVTKAIDTLEKAKLVKREPAGKDRREKGVSITGKGIELIESTMHQRWATYDEIMSCLDKNTMAELIKSLGQVRRHMRNDLL